MVFDAKLSSLNRKITSSKTKHLLVENQLKKLKSFDLGYLIGKSHFDEDSAQNCLVFQPVLRYFTLNSNCITKWKSKGLSNEILEVVSTTRNTLTPSVSYYGDKVKLRFTGSFLQQKQLHTGHKKIVNIYVAYEITNFPNIHSYPTLDKVLFRAVNPIQDGVGGQKGPPPPTSFSPVTSTNVGISPQNFLTFSFNPFSTLV